MNTKMISHKAPQWGGLTVLGTLVVAPLVSAPNAVDAAPVRYAQSQRQLVTVSGVVTQDLHGREFRMRSADGREFRVIIDAGREPRALSRNDRVTVNGYFNAGLFIANSLTITRNRVPAGRPNYGGTQRPYYGGTQRPYYGGTTRYGQTVLTGVVTLDLRGREFRMRANDGREFRVIVDAGREPRALSAGDRVQVTGHFTSGLFIANSLVITNNRGGWNNRTGSYPRGSYPRGSYPASAYPQGRFGQVTITGTVANIDSSTKLWVRAYNGITYEVVTSVPLAPRISEGDTVRVSGYGSAENLRANQVTLVRNIR